MEKYTVKMNFEQKFVKSQNYIFDEFNHFEKWMPLDGTSLSIVSFNSRSVANQLGKI